MVQANEVGTSLVLGAVVSEPSFFSFGESSSHQGFSWGGFGLGFRFCFSLGLGCSFLSTFSDVSSCKCFDLLQVGSVPQNSLSVSIALSYDISLEILVILIQVEGSGKSQPRFS